MISQQITAAVAIVGIFVIVAYVARHTCRNSPPSPAIKDNFRRWHGGFRHGPGVGGHWLPTFGAPYGSPWNWASPAFPLAIPAPYGVPWRAAW